MTIAKIKIKYFENNLNLFTYVFSPMIDKIKGKPIAPHKTIGKEKTLYAFTQIPASKLPNLYVIPMRQKSKILLLINVDRVIGTNLINC